MRALLVIAVAVVPSAVRGQIVTEMTPARIEDAIKIGNEATDLKSSCYRLRQGKTGMLNAGRPHVDVGCFTTPFSRVVGAAYSAKMKYKTVTPADVTPEMIAPEVHIHTFPVQDVRGRLAASMPWS